MIRANCRARFTAADFDFIVRTLARSQTDHVSLVDLLGDAETRDSVLDHPRLVDAILSNPGHLRISSQFYFYVLARHVLQQAGISDRKLCDYVGSLLETFSRASRLTAPDKIDNCGTAIHLRYAHRLDPGDTRAGIFASRSYRQLFAFYQRHFS